MTLASTEPETFSKKLWAATATDHSHAEHSSFMTALLAGELSKSGYVDLLAQYHRVYRALEAHTERLAADPIAGPFVDPALEQLEALAADLEFLAGPSWAQEFPAVPATHAYVARIEEVAEGWSGGYVAHHYTRYLGDLSGGVVIARIVVSTYGLEVGAGGDFSRFPDIADPTAYKAAYRATLDNAPWDDAEQARVIAEIRHAYDLNQAVFADLGHHVA